ncbi:hypothetical protein ASPCADRAFT_407978 [Aspergillus carbonarius ITEM 5010]|uniref:Up-regulated in Daf-2 domain-containing protein n=1 Tax=Aspergillus carbonarius (strain ITEM 5010) TaxID=602072 RepID=A0A1R3RF93_ASPC5|nr:hypothetical protein ASPCADRAFT_407978 [Aspergillus carbonarius ITEM 5010]
MSEQPISSTTTNTAQPSWFWETHHRTAKVVVRNNTNETILGVGLVHKYSNDYNEHKTWAKLAPGEVSSPLEVNYTTGDFTTGRDWWAVEWAAGKWFYYSDPANLRSLVDQLEKIAPDAAATLVGIAIAYANAQQKGGGLSEDQLEQVVKSAEDATRAIVQIMTNDESTKGFKQHILRDEDSDRVTEVVLNSDYTITFVSRSGDSRTKVSWREYA